MPVGKPVQLSPVEQPCWWYPGAMHDLMGVDDARDVSVLGACPVNADFAGTARLFVAYVRTHPEVLDERAALAGVPERRTHVKAIITLT